MSKAEEIELPGLMGEKPTMENLSESREKVATSGIGFAGLEAVPDETEPETPIADFEITDDMIPVPTGFHILVAQHQSDDRYSGSVIVKSEKEMINDRTSCVAMRVVAMGPDCYADEARFPNGAWCKVGDYILIQSYQGTKFKVLGRDLFRIINDDMVEAVIQDPTIYSRV